MVYETVTGKNVVFYKEATETGTVSFNSTTASYTKAQLGAAALINQLNANVSALSSEYSDLCTWSLGDDGLPKLNF